MKRSSESSGPLAYLVDRLIDLGLSCLFSLGDPAFGEEERRAKVEV
ncbi:MAG: hypothetical protein AAF368_04180 [Planctomycetota bacterium]